jgi:hypothetical protein
LEKLPLLYQQLYYLDSIIYEEHAKNTLLHDTNVKYLLSFEKVMFQNTCEIIVAAKGAGIQECDEFGNGIVQQGMVTVNVRYF